MNEAGSQQAGRGMGHTLLRAARCVVRGLGKLLLAVVCVLLIVGALLMLESAPRWVLAAVAIGVLLASFAILRTAHRRIEVKPQRHGASKSDDGSVDPPGAG